MIKKEEPKEEQTAVNVLALPIEERGKMFADEYNVLVSKYGIARMANPSFYPQDNGSFGIAVQYVLQDLIKKE